MNKEVVLRWLKKAENDIKAVEQLLEFEDAPADVIAFHCEQTIEKYLKAYLTSVDVRVKKTHDLEAILNLCIENDKEFNNLDKEKISELTFYAVEVRYPDEYIDIPLKKVKEFFKVAKEVQDFVSKITYQCKV